MRKIHFKLVVRTLLKNRLYSLINIVGLAIAIVLVLILTIFIVNERSVDSFHKNTDKIYRVVHDNGCAFSPPFGQYLVDHVSGIESYCRTFELDAVLAYAGTKISTPNCLFVDSGFFQMFSFPLIVGNRDNVIKSKNSILLSEGFAKQLFGSENPIGKQVKFKNRLYFNVTGIFQDFKENTHFNKPDAIFPFHSLDDVWFNGYLAQYDNRYFLAGLYVMTNGKSDLTNKGPEIVKQVKPWYWLFQDERNSHITFQPLKKAYLNPVNYGYPTGARAGNKSLLLLLYIIGIGILFIALFNYINLSLAVVVDKYKVTGVNKISGARNTDILVQSLIETAYISILSISLACLLLYLLLPVFNQLLNYHFTFIQLVNSDLLLKSLIIVFLVVLLSGLFSAFALTRISPMSSLNQKIGLLKIKLGQKVLVIFQFVISTSLIIAMLTIVKQNRYMRDFNLGFNKNETFYIKLNSDIKNQKLAFKNELSKISGVQAVSLCNGMPGIGIWNMMFDYKGTSKDFDVLNVDDDYFKVMGIKLAKPILNVENRCWINKSAAVELAWDSSNVVINIPNQLFAQTMIVNEVLPDMLLHSLYEKPRPTLITSLDTKGWVDYALLRLNTKSINTTLPEIKSVFKKFSSNFPIESGFLNEELNKAYAREYKTANIIGWFALFAILISVLGIFTLAFFSSNKRTKEIGIRKVNGANTVKVIFSLTVNFIKWVAIALVISTPIAYYAMHRWLQNFAYRTELSCWIFILAGLAAFSIAMITVSWQSWRAARRNPVECLRYE